MAQLEPTTQKFIDDLEEQGGAPLYELSVKAARKVLNDMQSGYQSPQAKTQDVELDDGLTIRIIKPYRAADDEVLPVVVYIHGGGWILGDEMTHDRLMKQIANGSRTAVVFVNYTRAPEAQYPTQIKQVGQVLEFIAREGEDYALDAGRWLLPGIALVELLQLSLLY